MTIWIYNMGLPVPLTEPRINKERSVESTVATTKTKKILTNSHKSNNINASEQTQNTKIKLTTLYSNLQKNKPDDRKLIYRADQLMSFPVQFLKKNNNLQDANVFLNKTGYRHIPVVNENNKLIGIITLI